MTAVSGSALINDTLLYLVFTIARENMVTPSTYHENDRKIRSPHSFFEIFLSLEKSKDFPKNIRLRKNAARTRRVTC
jgi:hypothetical protein